MTVPGNANPLLMYQAAGAAGYAIERSLRFNSADSAYLSRTPASAGNRKTWTWAGWVKRATFGTGYIFGCFVSGSDYCLVYPLSGGNIRFEAYNGGSRVLRLDTSNLFRDPSAWYHFVFTLDTSNATEASRAKIYVNGVDAALASSQYPTQNTDLQVNNTNQHEISSSVTPFNGYLADIHFIDGQALDPTSFGEFDTNGVWQPIAYTGTYGTNGFHLDFADNSSAAALGYDAAGSNDWTVNNIQATAPTYTYSSGWTANLLPGFPATNCFNGTGTSLTIGGSSVASVWTAPTSLAFTELRVRGGHDGAQILINGVNVTSQFASSVGWVTVTGVSSPLSTITLDNTSGAGNARISAVVVDGDMLVDGRPFKARDIDSLRDSPTNGSQTDTGVGGEVVGNYCTWNPLRSNTANPSNGNLQTQIDDDGTRCIAGTISVTSGKWYWEITCISGNNAAIGVSNSAGALSTIGFAGGNSWIYYQNAGGVYTPSGFIVYGTGWTVGDVIGVALDMDNGTLAYYKNGSSQGTAVSSGLSGKSIEPLITNGGGSPNVNAANFGQRPFAYTAPSGFKALCTANLPPPTIEDPSTVMDVALYTGNGSTQTISGLGFSPDFVWLKARGDSYNHYLFDQIRGAGNFLISNNTNAEGNNTDHLSAFTSTGFSLGASAVTNTNGTAFVGWTWDAGTSNATNTSGTITSTVRANISAGFSIVSYTGTGTTASVGHALGVAPSFIVCKSRTGTFGWVVYHQSLGRNGYLVLNSTDAFASASNYWGTSDPSSTVVSFSAGGFGGNNNSGTNYVMYCFAPVEGYSAFGSYTGNGSTDGPFVYTGFKTRWLLVKNTSTTSSWVIHDTTRSSYNVSGAELLPNSSGAEYTFDRFDILSNGFKNRTDNNASNTSGNTYVWAAFAENPFALNARAR